MSEPTALENMQAIRHAMVERRRYLAGEYHLGQQTDAEGRCSQIAAIQTLIESLDHAIEDEKKLIGGPVPPAFGSYGRQP
jgi:hypothetical protein